MPPIPTEPCSPGSAEDRYLSARQVRARYADASDMWIWRRLNDDSRFPKPLEICGRRFWKLSDLIAWERNQAVKSEAA
jgi:predicted DNA-binding transcriptional regulator AlpA